MSNDVVVAMQIDTVKKQLEAVARKRQYNLRHPDVVAVSQLLDDLIVAVMKKPAN